MTGNWRERFEPRNNGMSGNGPAFSAEAPPQRPRLDNPVVDPFSGEGALSPRDQSGSSDLDGLEIDRSVYRPWVLQRGLGRPALMLDFRRYDPRSALWTGWSIAYPHLIALEYIGDCLLSLDFGIRQFVIEGQGLAELAQRVQLGAVLAIQEYTTNVWPNVIAGPIIRTIRKVEA